MVASGGRKQGRWFGQGLRFRGFGVAVDRQFGREFSPFVCDAFGPPVVGCCLLVFGVFSTIRQLVQGAPVSLFVPPAPPLIFCASDPPLTFEDSKPC